MVDIKTSLGKEMGGNQSDLAAPNNLFFPNKHRLEGLYYAANLGLLNMHSL